MNSSWSGHVLIPHANLRGYELIYSAETWLRRMALAALIVTHGPAWEVAIGDNLRKQLQKQSTWNASRWYLGVESGEELLWSTTNSQLSAILRLSSIQDALRDLTQMSGEVLALHLDNIARIRNALAHSRALSPSAIKVLEGDLVVVNAAIRQFFTTTLYARVEIHLDPTTGLLAPLVRAVERTLHQNPKQQFFVATTPHFIQMTRLPVPPFGRWPKISRVKEELQPIVPWLLSCIVNLSGDEFSLVLPRATEMDDLLPIVDRFARVAASPDYWTTVPPESQDPAYSCWPRIWFYENSPGDE